MFFRGVRIPIGSRLYFQLRGMRYHHFTPRDIYKHRALSCSSEMPVWVRQRARQQVGFGGGCRPSAAHAVAADKSAWYIPFARWCHRQLAIALAAFGTLPLSSSSALLLALLSPLYIECDIECATAVLAAVQLARYCHNEGRWSKSEGCHRRHRPSK